jgi:hypothetical protein
MTTSDTALPFTFVDLDGTFGAPPFTITPHPGFADLTPVFVVKNMNPVPTAPDDFISIGTVAGAPQTLGPWSFVGQRSGPSSLELGSLTHGSMFSVLLPSPAIFPCRASPLLSPN